jgi:hypothetical protein
MSGVFQNIDPPPRLWCGGRTHSLGGKGVGGQYFGRRHARHCSVLYICKYFVVAPVYDSTVYTAESAASGSVYCTPQGAELHVDLTTEAFAAPDVSTHWA